MVLGSVNNSSARWLASSIGRMAWLALPVITVLAFIAAEMYRVSQMITISNLDYFPLLDRAVRLGFGSLDAWVHQIHPVGYPWLIRLGLELGWDAERVGQALSIGGGVLGLCGTYLLALSVFKDKRFAAIVQAFVAMTGLFLYFASVEGNDMPAAGIQLLSLGVLAASTLKRDKLYLGGVFLAGLLAGLAYLIRYNGMLTAMASGLWLILVALYERRSTGWKAIGVYVLAFFLGSAVQWIPSLIATSNPFYNDQGQNVWFHVYGKSDFIVEFNRAPEGITLFQVIFSDPVRFIGHWWDAFQRFWVTSDLTLLDAPLKLFGQAGFIFLLLAKGPASVRVRGLLAIFVLAHLAALSMMRLDRRFLLIMIPMLATGAVYLFASLIPSRWNYRRISLPLNALVMLAALAWAIGGIVGFAQGQPEPDWTVIRTSNVLHAAGMRSAQEVATMHLWLQDAAAPARDRFAQAYWLAPNQKSVDELVHSMQSQGWRFFVYDKDTGPKAYPDLQSLLIPETRPVGLAPIYFPDNRSFVVYRLAESPDCLDVGARFEGGIDLDCYEAYVTQDVPEGAARRLGVYLNWRADTQLDVSLKVFVHLLDASGQVVAQDDSAPVLWTYPTNEWEPGQVIVDFHQFPIDDSLPAGEYLLQVGLYDDETGIRVNRLDAAGHPVDDKVVLSEIQIE